MFIFLEHDMVIVARIENFWRISLQMKLCYALVGFVPYYLEYDDVTTFTLHGVPQAAVNSRTRTFVEVQFPGLLKPRGKKRRYE